MSLDRSRLGDAVSRQAVRVLERTGLRRRIRLGRVRVFELTAPPRRVGRMEDVTTRPAGPEDAVSLGSVHPTPVEVVESRFARGDRAWVAELEGRIVAHAWLHAGPEAFPEDAPTLVYWALQPGDLWCFAGASARDVRGSGLFVRLLQEALKRELEPGGASRVLSRVDCRNAASLRLHHALGFAVAGTLSCLALGPGKLLRWSGRGGPRHWSARLGRGDTLYVPRLA